MLPELSKMNIKLGNTSEVVESTKGLFANNTFAANAAGKPSKLANKTKLKIDLRLNMRL